MKRILLFTLLLLSLTSLAFGQANGKLQIHFIDVGQGDAAVLISPEGEIVLFDNGVAKHCDLSLSYLKKIGISSIDYHIASHYHDDHIGCTTEILKAFPLLKAGYDRGYSISSATFNRYRKAIGSLRKPAIVGDKIVLDAATDTPVNIEFVAVNGAGVNTSNENDLSLVAVIRFGRFDVVMGGDLSGYDKNNYKDIESIIADNVGQTEVYKVHHHCSRYSSNEKWLSMIRTKVGIISASGTIGRNYGHPTQECLDRLHKYEIKTYWTEIGGGALTDPFRDKVVGNILVECEPNSYTFTVSNGSLTESYPLWDDESKIAQIDHKYVWSRNSKVYHYPECKDAKRIKPGNLESGDTSPQGKELHKGCPK